MTKLTFNKQDSSPSIEITIQVRDKNGDPTGKTRSFGGKSPRDASDWYAKQSPRKKKRRRKKKEPKK
tara:strand:- start:1312 stop:1512 length:201 start_codon:yes stop_codon:yes gene_type:complete